MSKVISYAETFTRLFGQVIAFWIILPAWAAIIKAEEFVREKAN